MQIDPSESPIEVAQRYAAQTSPGDLIEVGVQRFIVFGYSKRVYRTRTTPRPGSTLWRLVPPAQETPQTAPVASVGPLVPESVGVSPPTPQKVSRAPERPSIAKDVSTSMKASIEVGQKWVPKDPRRRQVPFTVVSVEGDAVKTDDGRSIALYRMSRYRQVEEELAVQA